MSIYMLKKDSYNKYVHSGMPYAVCRIFIYEWHIIQSYTAQHTILSTNPAPPLTVQPRLISIKKKKRRKKSLIFLHIFTFPIHKYDLFIVHIESLNASFCAFKRTENKITEMKQKGFFFYSLLAWLDWL